MKNDPKSAMSDHGSPADDDLARLIETRLLGVRPDSQDLQLEDHDWERIIAALSRRAPAVMTPMEELREQAAKIARGWPKGGWTGEAIAEAIEAMPLPAPVALPQAGVEPVACLWTCPDGSSFTTLSKVTDTVRTMWIDKGYVETALGPISPTPTETPTAATPDDISECHTDKDLARYWHKQAQGARSELSSLKTRMYREISQHGRIVGAPDDGLITDDDIVGLINIVTDLQELDALEKAYPEVLTRLQEIVSRRSKPDDGLMGRYREALKRLERAATQVRNKGAVTGPQWVKLNAALVQARTALSTATGDEAQQGEG